MSVRDFAWLVLWIMVAAYAAKEWALMRDAQRRAEERLDAVLANLEGLRQYLYEIDPQFDDERAINDDLAAGRFGAEMDDIEIAKAKEAAGKRTLNTPLA